MHRFQPRIYLVLRSDGSNAPITDIEREKYRTYIFPETIFTAVTAYQNQLVSYLFQSGFFIHPLINLNLRQFKCSEVWQNIKSNIFQNILNNGQNTRVQSVFNFARVE